MGSSGSAQQEGSRSAPDPRRETLAQRDDRNLAELVQELRVVSLGVQVLFGFLLSLPFTVRFSRLGTGQRDLYLASLVLSAAATVLLLGPVAYHRILFRRGLKEPVVRYANMMAVLGLAVVGAAMLAAVLLVTSVVAGWAAGVPITAVMACALVVLWFAVPLARRGGTLSRACRRADVARYQGAARRARPRPYRMFGVSDGGSATAHAMNVDARIKAASTSTAPRGPRGHRRTSSRRTSADDLGMFSLAG